MSETASGFVRITTLILVTAAFAVVWRGDQQAQQQFVIARKAAGERAAILAHHSAHREAARQLRAIPSAPKPAHASAAPSAHSRIARVEIEMELPAGITPGTYQVVDQSGRMQRIRIPEAPAAIPHQDLYMLDQPDGGRRFFIRISEGFDRAPTQTAAAPLSFQQ
jgi:hypothetical protein